jgi:pilus assembly protein CpaE
LQQDRRLTGVPFIAISSRFDADEMGLFLKAGFAEYYAKSGMAGLSLVEALPRLVSECASKVKKDDKGLLCVFMSAKGGLGTSSLCANIGHNLAAGLQQPRTAVADLVLPMGSIASITGYEGELNLGTIARSLESGPAPDSFWETLPVPEGWGFHLLPGSPDPEVAFRLPAEQIAVMLKALRKSFQNVIVDLGRMLSRLVLPVIQEADTIVLVVGTDLSSVELTGRLWSYLQSQGITRERVFPILNRAVGLQGMTKAEAEAALGIEIRLTIPYLMENFALANNLHVPLTSKYPNDTVSMILKQAAVDIARNALKSHTGELKLPPAA